MERLKELKNQYPNWVDLGREVRREFSTLILNNNIYNLNKDVPNDSDLGKLIDKLC